LVAAQSGFTFAEEAITLGELIPSSDTKQQQRYINSMLKLAEEGRGHAADALEQVRDIRMKVYEVCCFSFCGDLSSIFRSALG
jgi:hypothetical protein